MKFIFKHSPKPVYEERAKTLKECILEDLEKTKFDLETAYSGFDNATDPDLIDCYIYEVNSIMKRYKYLLNQVSCLTDYSEISSETFSPTTEENPVIALP